MFPRRGKGKKESLLCETPGSMDTMSGRELTFMTSPGKGGGKRKGGEGRRRLSVSHHRRRKRGKGGEKKGKKEGGVGSDRERALLGPESDTT